MHRTAPPVLCAAELVPGFAVLPPLALQVERQLCGAPLLSYGGLHLLLQGGHLGPHAAQLCLGCAPQGVLVPQPAWNAPKHNCMATRWCCSPASKGQLQACLMLSASGAGLLCLMLHELTVISCSAQYTCSLHAGQHTLLGPVQWRQGLTASEGREAFSVPARLAQSRLCSPYEAARMGSVRTGAALAEQGRHASAGVSHQNGQRAAAALPHPHLRCSSMTRLLWAPSICSRAAVSCARRSRTSICAARGWQGQRSEKCWQAFQHCCASAKQVGKHVCRDPKPPSPPVGCSYDGGHRLASNMGFICKKAVQQPTPRSCSCLSSAVWAARSARMASMSCTRAVRSRGQCFCWAQQAASQVCGQMFQVHAQVALGSQSVCGWPPLSQHGWCCGCKPQSRAPPWCWPGACG